MKEKTKTTQEIIRISYEKKINNSSQLHTKKLHYIQHLKVKKNRKSQNTQTKHQSPETKKGKQCMPYKVLSKKHCVHKVATTLH